MVHKRQTPVGLGYPQEKTCVDVSKWSDIYYKIETRTVCQTEFRKQCIDRSEEVIQNLAYQFINTSNRYCDYDIN